MTIFVFALLFLWAYAGKAAEVCYDDLGCFTDELSCHKSSFPPFTPEEIGSRFFLYTRRSRNNPYQLLYNDRENIHNSLFDGRRKTKLISHGYLGNFSEQIYHDLKDAFLDREDMNIIIVDWRPGAVGLYPQAMQNARVYGRQIATLIRTLNLQKGAYFKDFHLLGYSLGGHAVGYAGEEISGLGRITGLDPAGPGFQNTDIAKCRLDKTDALLVDVIHTDGSRLGYGTMVAWGHMDFYPNGGKTQPGCSTILDPATVCSHERARDYFHESIMSTECSFTAQPCESWNRYRLGLCESCGVQGCPVMGLDAYLNPREGTFYLETNSDRPFCIK